MQIKFPREGINKGRATFEQPKETSPDMNNMRLYSTFDNRASGSQRPGLDKWGAGTLIGAAEQPVVAICTVSSVV